MTETTLDDAHAKMVSEPDNDAARVAFYDCFADCQIILLLNEEATGETVSPATVELAGETYTVVFDSQERLSAFSGEVSPYAELSGRGLAEMLTQKGIGIALNPDVAPSAMLISPQAVDWLAATLANAPAEAVAKPVEISRPGTLPDALVSSLTRKLTGAGALAASAWLTGVTYDDGSRGHLLVFVGVAEPVQTGLANAANEALTFSGIDAGSMDVTFVDAGSDMADRVERLGRPIALSMPEVPEGPSAPGMDPNSPPKLK